MLTLKLNHLAALLFFFLGCDPAVPSDPEENTPDGNAFIIDLNHLTYTIANEHDNFYSFIGVRALTMVHLAVHDALNVTHPQYETYAYHQPNADGDPIVAATAVAATEAARNILLKAYPQRSDTIDLICEGWINTVSESEDKTKGIELGKAIADTYIQLREGDGHGKQGDYTPMTKPGNYQYTPGWDNWVLKPDFDYARPFALDSVTQFRSPSPPGLTSEEYAQSYNEVKALGAKNSPARTEDQTHFAHWWAEFAEHGWNRIGRIVAEEQNLTAYETARMFALINMDIYDIYLASLESKYHYDTWRPLTAIKNADTDGNPDTQPDPDWEPEMLTPPWPEYPSAHASVAAGGAAIVSQVLGTAEVSFTMESVSAFPTGSTRSYYNLNQAADDCADSRIMNGYHFRFATEEGKRQGNAIAQYIMANYLKPIH